MKEATTLKENINKYTWDGEWYTRAYKDNGEPLGSKNCEEGKLYLNAQTWAIINDTANQERKKLHINLSKKILV